MFAFVSAAAPLGLGSSTSTYFAVIPGVSKTGSSQCPGNIMNSAACQSTAGSWRATDNGTWWLRFVAVCLQCFTK